MDSATSISYTTWKVSLFDADFHLIMAIFHYACTLLSILLLESRDVKRSSNIRTSPKVFEFEFVFDPSKFDFQIPAGLNSVKSVLWLH